MREVFGILFNVVETSQTLSLSDTLNRGNLPLSLDVEKLKSFQLQGGFAP